MDNLVALYKKCFNLSDAVFSFIEHDAMVAIVYRITQPGRQLILKICTRPKDFLREVYFLKYFSEKIPVPHIIQLVEPDTDIHGAILMECLPGSLVKPADFTETLSFQIGSLLARIHMNRTAGYGDLIEPDNLSSDPRIHFALKFEEGLEECSELLSQKMLEKCRYYFDKHLSLLINADGPCVTHRDFRPGNAIICDGKLQGIIDWSSGRASFAQEDFCSMEHGEWLMPPAAKKYFFEGYASIRPIPSYNEMMPLLRLSKAIATIGFTIKSETWTNRHAQIYQFNRNFLDAFLSTT